MNNRKMKELSYEAQRFCDYRHKYGMTQKKWAECLQLALPTVKKIENGSLDCSDKTIEKLEHFLRSHPIAEDGTWTATNDDSHDNTPLEERIFKDLIMSEIRFLNKNDAELYAQRVYERVHAIINKAYYLRDEKSEKAFWERLLPLLDVLNDLSYFDSSNVKTLLKSVALLDGADPTAAKWISELLQQLEHMPRTFLENYYEMTIGLIQTWTQLYDHHEDNFYKALRMYAENQKEDSEKVRAVPDSVIPFEEHKGQMSIEDYLHNAEVEEEEKEKINRKPKL